jgi:hypothetical protein
LNFLSWRNLDRCLSYVEELMVREGPFDGLLGFSQGAAMSAVLAGLQEQVRKKSSVCLSDRVSCYGCGLIYGNRFFRQGLALTGVAKVRYAIAIAGGGI